MIDCSLNLAPFDSSSFLALEVSNASEMGAMEFEILRIPTAPGYEDLVFKHVLATLSHLRIPFRQDSRGNLIAKIPSKSKQPGLAFSVHMDHPGFKVLKLRKNQIECSFLGGVPREFFKKGVPVELFDSQGRVVAQARVMKVLRWKLGNRRILLKASIPVPSTARFGMWKLTVFKKSSTHVIARACDDLAGCAAVLATLKNLRKLSLKRPVLAIFTRREEIGLKGAFEIAKSKLLPKSIAVVSVETSKELCNARQGDGPIIRVGDRTSIFNPELTKRLCDVAKKLKKKSGFKFQRRLMDGGTCETTAFLESGYAAGGLCVALGNYHNCGAGNKIAAENIHYRDWQGLVELMTAVGKG
jgi:putative aminopeptidase FrvX